jgi:hypothetical protein
MNIVFQLLQEVATYGVTLSAEPPDLFLQGPTTKVPDELKRRLRRHKKELLELLTKTTELPASIKQMENANITIGILDDGTMRILTSRADQDEAVADGAVMYTPTDYWHSIQLQPAERELLRSFKKTFPGGSTEWKARS